MKKIFLAVCLIILTACDIKLFSNVNISDIFSSDHKVTMADLKVYVTSCNEDEIKKIETELNKRNIIAHYNKCAQDDAWNDYANFSVPLAIVKNNNNPVKTASDIYFYYDSGKLYLKTSNHLEALLKQNLEFYSKVRIASIEFSLTNDIGEDIKIKPTELFVDEKPILAEIITVSPYQKINIKLSNVANKLLERSNVTYPLFEVIGHNAMNSTNDKEDNRIGSVIELN